MSTPKRIQRQRTKGWRMPEGAMYVGRPSKWGNPCALGDVIDRTRANDMIHVERIIIGTGAQAVEFYRRWLTGTAFAFRRTPPTGAQILDELRGHDLACWCPLDQPCHADVLLELANAEVVV